MYGPIPSLSGPPARVQLESYREAEDQSKDDAPQAPPHTPQADDVPVALAVEVVAATDSAKPSTLSLPTADPAAEVAADRSLEAPLLKAQLAAEGSGKQWLEDNNLSASKVPPQWIATMADDIALATSFWR